MITVKNYIKQLENDYKDNDHYELYKLYDTHYTREESLETEDLFEIDKVSDIKQNSKINDYCICSAVHNVVDNRGIIYDVDFYDYPSMNDPLFNEKIFKKKESISRTV